MNRIEGIVGGEGHWYGVDSPRTTKGTPEANRASPLETLAQKLRKCAYQNDVDGVWGIYDKLMEQNECEDGHDQREQARGVKRYLDFVASVADIMMARGVDAETAAPLALTKLSPSVGAVQQFYRDVVGKPNYSLCNPAERN